ncbi:signal peptidase II [Anaerosporobacter sp.]|uniref:signal peptidase II n=1 Tax=Anaerosporobacter sp. TaxID=1872529 RepID=UPI00286EF84B|nr:signal peptidase II [Anaerosporobacter sp.]
MKKWSIFLGVNFILVLLDQFTKHLAKSHLMGNNDIPIIDGVFRLQYLENRGAAFGILENKIGYFIIGTLIALGVLCYAYQKLPDTRRYLPMKILLIFISAGAIGNFIDRLFNNYVVDFFYFELINFPIFNVADCYVTVSSVIFLVLGIFYYKDEDFEFLKWKKGISV